MSWSGAGVAERDRVVCGGPEFATVGALQLDAAPALVTDRHRIRLRWRDIDLGGSRCFHCLHHFITRAAHNILARLLPIRLRASARIRLTRLLGLCLISSPSP